MTLVTHLPALSCAWALLLVPPASAAGDDQDMVLARLVYEVQTRSPEVAAAAKMVEASGTRVPQAGAWPDPVLSFGIQNDSFTQISIGSAETSWYGFFLSQTFPWPGKADLRQSVVSAEARQARAGLNRVQLNVEAAVGRNYVSLVLVRDQLELLSEFDAFWEQAEGVAKSRFETGQSSQYDLLRAKLERARLQQRRTLFQAAEASRLAALNRLRVRPLGEPLSTPVHLDQMGEVTLAALKASGADAEARSPELAVARFAVDGAAARTALANRDPYPDLTLSAGVMLRGSLVPMWQLGLSFPLPIYFGQKQGKAIDERVLEQAARSQDEQRVLQLLALRADERTVLLRALLETNLRYRDLLLVLGEAATKSALGQYAVGRLPFSAVLEALTSNLADKTTYLESLGAVQRVAIAARQLSLEAPPDLPLPAVDTMPGAASESSASSTSSAPLGTEGAGGKQAM